MSTVARDTLNAPGDVRGAATIRETPDDFIHVAAVVFTNIPTFFFHFLRPPPVTFGTIHLSIYSSRQILIANIL